MAKNPAAPEQTRIVNRWKLYELRTKAGWLQRELAKKAGVYQGTISKLERGDMGKGGEKCEGTVLRIAAALQVEPEVLYEPPSPDFVIPTRTPRGYPRVPRRRKVRHKTRHVSAPGLSSKPIRSKPILSAGSTKPKIKVNVSADGKADRSPTDSPLVTTIMTVAAGDLARFSWRDIQTAVEAALESVAYLSGGTDLVKISRVLLESARVNRLKLNGQVAPPVAVLATALYRRCIQSDKSR